MEEAKLGGNGNEPPEALVETEDEAKEVEKTLDGLIKKSGFSFSRQELGILKQLLHSPEAAHDSFIDIMLILDFETEEERQKVVRAYDEAVHWGMDLNMNIRDALSRAATNRRGGHRNSRAAFIGDVMSHRTLTTNIQGKKHGYSNNSNARSPLS